MAEPGAGGRGMSRAEWLATVIREANVIHGDLGGAADPVDLDRAACERAARIITRAADPLDFVRHSSLSEPDVSLWRDSPRWSDAVVAVACSCLEHDIAEHARKIASGEMPEMDPERIVGPQ